jgi:hypothetical protein
MQQNDEKTLKEYIKWIKMCKKLNLISARMGDWEYSAAPVVPKLSKSKKNDTIEGLVHDPSIAQPPDSEMLFYSTPSFDLMRESRKDNTPR